MRVLDEIGWPSLLKTENLVQGEGVLQPCLFQFFRASRAGAAFAFVCTLGLAHRAAAKTNSGSGKTHRQMDLAAARADRKAIVGANMNLTEAQAKAFWPLYDAYEKRMDKLETPPIVIQSKTQSATTLGVVPRGNTTIVFTLADSRDIDMPASDSGRFCRQAFWN